MRRLDEKSMLRAFVKSITWRIIAVTITTIVVLLVTREWKFAATVGSIDAVVKFVGYYLHERAWQKIDLGRTQDDPSPESVRL